MALAFFLLLLTAAPEQIPTDPGLYLLSENGLTRIEGRPVTLERSGSRLTSSATLGIRGDSRVDAQVLGQHAEQKVTTTPVFYYRIIAGSEASAGASDLVLVRLKIKKKRREFVVSMHGDWKGSAGVPLRSQVEVHKKQVESTVFKFVPAQQLQPGDYGFFLFRGYDLPAIIYDFSVE